MVTATKKFAGREVVIGPLRIKAIAPTIALFIFSFSISGQSQEFYLREGDRVVFYGDSITEQLLYTTFVETFVVTRWPKLKVSFVNSGWGGDRVGGGRGGAIDLRLKRDVIDHRPSVVTVMLGMNDANVAPHDATRFNTFADGYRHIVKTLKEALPGLRITLLRPSPYDDVTRPPLFKGGYNAVLVRYGDFIAELAREMKLDLADLNKPVVVALTKANSTNAQLAQRFIPDRVHPRPSGHLLMAQALLLAWNAPARVSVVEFDGAKGKISKEENTEVSDFSVSNGATWTQRDRALPMPLDFNDPVLALAVESSDFMETLNQQLLKVTGLEPRNYTLRIDDVEVGKFSHETLADGVNLAKLPTPMSKQAAAVHALTLHLNQTQFIIWRELHVRFQEENTPVVLEARAAMAKLEAELLRRQREIAIPKAHRFALIPVS